MTQRGRDGYFHPGSVEDVRELVVEAATRGVVLRVRGSGHSVPGAIHADRPVSSGSENAGMDVMLDRLRDVVITPANDGTHAVVEVGAGCNLGLDPYDPSGTSTWDNSLNVRLHRAGWALDAMGGISHQTVAGFLLTGSAGGSTQHSLADTVLRMQFVDGNGDVHEVGCSDTGEKLRLFRAVGVSMGLLGIITKVWLRVRPAYDLVGREVTTSLADCSVDFLCEAHDDRPDLFEFLRSAAHSRIFWWPQRRFDRIQAWSARPEQRSDLPRTPFEILSQGQTLSGSLVQTVLGHLPDLSQVPQRLESLGWFRHLERALAGVNTIDELRPAPAAGFAKADVPGWRQSCARGLRSVTEGLARLVFERGVVRKAGVSMAARMPGRIHRLMRLYVPDGTKEFRDDWHSVMPMDDNLDVELWPTSFAELWFPMDATPAVMKRLREIHHQSKSASERYALSRAFPIEIYAGARSPFWLSPGYEQESLRVNLVWCDQWPEGSRHDFYESYFDALKEFCFRPHWGKYLPAPSDEWRSYYRRHFPQLRAFLDLRSRLDPRQVFVSEYWRRQLGV